jgi:hypothetical protein
MVIMKDGSVKHWNCSRSMRHPKTLAEETRREAEV